MQRTAVLSIAGILIRIETGEPWELEALRAFYAGFMSDEGRRPDLLLRSKRVARLPDLPAGAHILFDTETTWRIWQSGTSLVMEVRSSAHDSPVFRSVHLSQPLGRGVVFTLSDVDGAAGSSIQPDPVAFPVSELLLMLLLDSRRGALVHASGVLDRETGKAALFPGNSGAGKSTIARLWAGAADCDVLNDDRIAVIRARGGFEMHGTPWSGSFRARCRGPVPLDAVFFLRHDAENTARPLGVADAVKGLLSRSFLPFWDPVAMASAVGLFEGMAESVPFFDLGFVPDGSVLECVRGALSS